MRVRNWLAHTLLGFLIVTTALVSVGLTASPDGAFSISIHPILLRLDRTSIEQSRARALGLDVDIKIGSLHMHLGWSALPISKLTTNGAAESL